MPRPLATSCRMATVSSAVRRLGLMLAGVRRCFLDVQHFVGHGIRNECLGREVRRFQPGLGGQAMPRAHQRHAFVAKQGTEYHGRMIFLPIVDDGQFGLAVIEERGSGLTTNPEMMSNSTSGPKAAIGVHCRHEPVEAVMALHRDA